MRTLIVEDESMSREQLYEYLSPYGDCVMIKDGKQAIDTFKAALEENNPFDLVCVDTMMPEINAQQVLKELRFWEKSKGIMSYDRTKAILITALGNQKNIIKTFLLGSAAKYLAKPIKLEKLLNELRDLGLMY